MSLLNRIAEIAQELRRRHTITDDAIAAQLEEAARLSNPPAAGMRYAWVIANGNGTGYRSRDALARDSWTGNLSAAIHYATRADAETAAEGDEDAWHIYLVEVAEDEDVRLVSSELAGLRGKLKRYKLVEHGDPEMWKEEATAAAAQLWCTEATQNIVMDPPIAFEAARVIQAWMDTAASFGRNADWYRKLLTQTAAHLPDERVMFDDTGKRCDEPFVSKVPEVVGELVIALGQASDLALYVESRAKGEMVKATKEFLGNQHAQWVARRLEAGCESIALSAVKAFDDHKPSPKKCNCCNGVGTTIEHTDGPNFPVIEQCLLCDGKGVVP